MSDEQLPASRAEELAAFRQRRACPVCEAEMDVRHLGANDRWPAGYYGSCRSCRTFFYRVGDRWEVAYLHRQAVQ